MTVVSGRGAHVLLDTCPERHVLLLEAATVMSLLVRALLLVILFFLKKVMLDVRALVKVFVVEEVFLSSLSSTSFLRTRPAARV